MLIFDNILKTVPSEIDTTNYVFFCSKDIKYNSDSYKGFRVFKINVMKEDTIYFTEYINN